MAKSIVFLMPVPLSAIFARRWGLRILEDKGISTHVMDLTGLLNGQVFRQKAADEFKVQGTRVHAIHSYPEFEEKIKELSPTAVFMDGMVSIRGIDIKHERIFRILKKHHAKYYVISDADLPTHLVREGESKKEFLQRFFRRFNMRWLGRYTARLVLRGLTQGGLYPLPVKVFGTESENVKNYLRKFKNHKIPFIAINSFDYSVYLDYVRNNRGMAPDAAKTCVFIDEAVLHNYDYDILGLEKPDEKKYLNDMNRLFDAIEKETGLEVVIAAHPKSRYQENPGAFGHRKIIKGQTVDLVAKSRLVVLHSSTAVSFAVLFNKPLLIVKTNDMVRIKRDIFIDVLAKELGVASINIEDPKQMEGLSDAIKGSSNNNFRHYKYKYLASPGLEDFTTWDIIAEEIKKEECI